LKNPDGVPLRLRERGAVEPELELTPDDHDDDETTTTMARTSTTTTDTCAS
jgi:hypothetical protein